MPVERLVILTERIGITCERWLKVSVRDDKELWPGDWDQDRADSDL